MPRGNGKSSWEAFDGWCDASLAQLHSRHGRVFVSRAISLAMSGNIEWTKAATLQLIDLIKQHPSLWQVHNKNYKNKTVRSASLNAVVKELMDAMKCVITAADIMKKLHTLRSQYRREMKEVKASQKSGAGTDDLYVPKLWCFDALTFLCDGDTPRDSTSNLDELVSQVSQLLFLFN